MKKGVLMEIGQYQVSTASTKREHDDMIYITIIDTKTGKIFKQKKSFQDSYIYITPLPKELND